MKSELIDLGGPTHFLDFGGTGTPLVLIHGLGGSALNWLRVGQELTARHHVYALDLVGFGRTPPADRSATVDGHTKLVTDFIATLPGPATLVGNSMGGLVSLSVAAKQPDTLRSVVLVDPAVPRYDNAPIDRAVGVAFGAYAIPGLGEAWMRRVAKKSQPETVLEYFMSLCGVNTADLPKTVYDAHLDMARYRRALPWNDTVFLSSARSILAMILIRSRWEALVQNVTVPVHLLHGARDRLVSVVSARAISRQRPNWHYTELAGRGHTPMLEAPAEFVEALQAFTH